jgi:hypothetical protein
MGESMPIGMIRERCKECGSNTDLHGFGCRSRIVRGLVRCTHPAFHSRAVVTRVHPTEADADVVAFGAEFSTQCADCGVPFVFMGADIGIFGDRPGRSPDGLSLRVPLRPANVMPGFGQGIPGYAVLNQPATKEPTDG